jgi:pSer/pThr/pTyr-binding forkhead associated (FHA) protein
MKDYKVSQPGVVTPNSELRLRPALRYALRYRGQIFPIAGGQATVGRNLDCDVVLSGPLVSRVHARILIDANGVTIEDLLSRNGVAVDGVLIDRPRRIEPGTRIRLGDETVELLAERLDQSTYPEPLSRSPSERISTNMRTRERERPSAPGRLLESQRPSGQTRLSDSQLPSGLNTVPDQLQPQMPEEYDELTHRADLFDLLGAAVERAFAVNNGDEVVRLLGRHMERIVEQARNERDPNDELYGRAALYAVRLGVTMGKAIWFDYVVRLYATLSVPLPLPIVDQLSAHIRRVPGMNRQLLRDYVGQLRNVAGRMTAEQRFRLQRVESLERLVSL